MTDLQEGVSTLLGRDMFGEASANYLLGCGISEKVAREMSLGDEFDGENPAARAGFLACLAPQVCKRQ